MQWLKDLRTKWLIRRYEAVGAYFGDMLSYSFMGKAYGFDGAERKFRKLEKKIHLLGYKPHDLNDFVAYGGGYVPALPPLKKYEEPGLVPHKDLLLYEVATMLRNADDALNKRAYRSDFQLHPKTYMFLYVEAAKGLFEVCQKLASHRLSPSLSPIQRTPEQWLDLLLQARSRKMGGPIL